MEIRIDHKRSKDVYGIVDSLSAHGLKQGVDYDYAYHPGWMSDINDIYNPDPDSSGHIIVKFYNEKFASWFRLKWK